MSILIVYLTLKGFASLICIYSFILVFRYFTGCISHVSLIVVLNKLSRYSFRSSHWEIFYKIAILNQY